MERWDTGLCSTNLMCSIENTPLYICVPVFKMKGIMGSGSSPNLGVYGSAISELCQGKQPCFSSTLSWQEVCTLSEESDLWLNAAILEHFKLLLYKENGGFPLCKPEKFWYFPGPLFPSHAPTQCLFADSLSETKENAVTCYKLQHRAEITQQ